jgi:hypothetical protein
MSNGTTSIRPVQIALVTIFFTMLWLPLADNLLGLDHSRPSDENRTLSPAPSIEMSGQALKEFPRSFEAFYDDRFGFRNFLVRQFHTVNFGWLGIADPEKVVKGKEGWLYLGRKILIDESRGLAPLKEGEAQAWARNIDAIRQWQESRGGTFLLVLVPDKQRIFPEYLPDWYVPSEHRRKEQLITALAPLGTPVLDVTEALRAAKQQSTEPIWLRTDTHWNGMGAWAGYRAILERLEAPLPAIHPMEKDALIRAQEPGLGAEAWHSTNDLAGLLGVRDLAPEPWLGLLPDAPRAKATDVYPKPSRKVGGVNVPYATVVDDSNLPSALVIGGSFRWALVPLLSENFRRVLYTDFRYCFFDPKLAGEEKPDVILFVMTEQQLVWFPEPPDESTW